MAAVIFVAVLAGLVLINALGSRFLDWLNYRFDTRRHWRRDD